MRPVPEDVQALVTENVQYVSVPVFQSRQVVEQAAHNAFTVGVVVHRQRGAQVLRHPAVINDEAATLAGGRYG